jgi:hypothetical protein
MLKGPRAACLGRAVGALRFSPGLATNRRDLERAITFVTSFVDPCALTPPHSALAAAILER